MQVLHHQQHRLHLALPQQEPLERLQRLPPALRGIEARPPGVRDRCVEQRQEHGQHRLQSSVEGEELARYLFAHLPIVVARLNPEVAA